MASNSQSPPRWALFVFFFISGFCGLVYQVIWTRLAFASFGIITPVLSVVISVFMFGLSIGSWAGGRFIALLVRKTRLSAAMFYAVIELIIGLSAYAVPRLFSAGEHLLLSAGESNSFRYLLLSALVLGFSILPWCICMGATFPFMMAYIRETYREGTDSFSYLYVANVLGAMSGAVLAAVVFIEVFGFESTLRLAAGLNFAIGLASGYLGLKSTKEQRRTDLNAAPAASPPGTSESRLIKWILFSTGFSAMGMEVVWTRLFTPTLKTQVYSFALILFIYLGATLAGSLCYRRHLKKGRPWQPSKLMAFLAVAAFIPVLAGDPRLVQMDTTYTIPPLSALGVLASIFPLCAFLGYLTPSLIDRFSSGNPAEAGRAYALNVLGCILGPLVASYALLPHMSERTAVVLLSLPFLAFYFYFWKGFRISYRLWSSLGVGCLFIYCAFFSQSFAESFRVHPGRVEERRDYAASVISADTSGYKVLLVNGIGMTKLTPITKFMAHLPLALHTGQPQSALVICFGMGTSYRSALSWDVDTTAVELIPGVANAFGFYHANASDILKNPKGHVVIDDGRRFLKRTQEKYDVVIVDPPPPLEAAGSSLLFSTEFYDLLKQHLNPHGIVQMWLPGGEALAVRAVTRSAYDSFTYVRCYPSVEGWGIHILGSMEPIENRTPDQLAAAMPASAKQDLLEWSPGENVSSYLGKVITHEVSSEQVLNPNREIKITDDDPLNEYFLLRQTGLF
jgi:predicted membrane-bound spermidine synthase